jgi:uncharacterized protein (DUF2336 family)
MTTAQAPVDAPQQPIDYKTSKRLAASRDHRHRKRVGAHDMAPPEVLYYLAADPHAEVRAAVAGNRATPNPADLLLARDLEHQVRCHLAAKVAALVPALARDKDSRAYQTTLAVLDILVRDQVHHVRKVVAETLKHHAHAPTHVIGRLARDPEITVASPVLEHSPVLADDDLLAIIAEAPIPGALASIARRGVVSEAIADAISASDDDDAIATLLANPSAQIREEVLDRLVERAPDNPTWHRSFVLRPKLPGRLVKKLASFVATHLLEALRARADLDPATAAEVEETVMRRLQEEPGDLNGVPKSAGESAAEALAAALRLHADGRLGEPEVLTAITENIVFARAALAVLANIPLDLVARVLDSHSTKGITALVWKAGLSMLAASRIQQALGRIPSAKILRPGRDGSYPLTPDAMRWQLEFLTGLEGL